MAKRLNALAQEQSPYLLQHAENPVQWFPWREEHLKRAQKENKLLIISIGYAACHWCHVMEHESFEDEAVANLMNQHFVNLKVDREERPDIDHVYMQALQLLTGQGGWPLNIVALPDGRPVWGGTYFKKEQWMGYLDQLVQLQQQSPEKLLHYAERLEEGMKQLALTEPSSAQVSKEQLADLFNQLYKKIDPEFGGMQGAPKFMMPTLLDAFLTSNTLNEHVHFSLKKMALGGLFDVLGGGFSRYSVDHRWHVPHFEKMGYDNGQLLATYSRAFREKQDPLYREVVEKTIAFLTTELQHPSGGFYASLDADSLDRNGRLTEGAYYVWTKEELTSLGLLNQAHFEAYFGVNQTGYWEEENHVFYRLASAEGFIEENKLSPDFHLQINAWEQQLLKVRDQRPQPRLDDKIICSWNAMVGRGLLEAYSTFGQEHVRGLLENVLQFFPAHFHREDHGLYRLNKEGAKAVNGFLEDYAHLIAFYLDAYEQFFTLDLLEHVTGLIDYCFQHFYTDDSPFFLFSEERDLVVETRELNDNVIPSSNAVMAENLLRAGGHLGRTEWTKHGEEMLDAMAEDLLHYPRAHSTWLRLYQQRRNGSREVVVVGPQAIRWIQSLKKTPQAVQFWAASETAVELPLLQHRFQAGKTLIYLCENNQCGLPLDQLEEAKKALKLI